MRLVSVVLTTSLQGSLLGTSLAANQEVVKKHETGEEVVVSFVTVEVQPTQHAESSPSVPTREYVRQIHNYFDLKRMNNSSDRGLP